MKMKREDLKALIKECLIEILVDGLGSSINESKIVSRRPVEQLRQQVQTRRPPSALDLPARPQIQEAIKQATKDPVMASIFADTAATTLVNQNSAGHAGGASTPSPAMAGDMAQRIVAQTDPLELFGEAANKWSEVAFAPRRGGAK